MLYSHKGKPVKFDFQGTMVCATVANTTITTIESETVITGEVRITGIGLGILTKTVSWTPPTDLDYLTSADVIRALARVSFSDCK
jgi:hypothetical protein